MNKRFLLKKTSQSCGFSSGHVWMWELDYKESWVLKDWCFWTVVLEKTLESPLDCKEMEPVHPEGDQSWVFIGRTDVEAETPILWPPDKLFIFFWMLSSIQINNVNSLIHSEYSSSWLDIHIETYTFSPIPLIDGSLLYMFLRIKKKIQIIYHWSIQANGHRSAFSLWFSLWKDQIIVMKTYVTFIQIQLLLTFCCICVHAPRHPFVRACHVKLPALNCHITKW